MPGARGHITRLLRGVAAIVEVVIRDAVGGCAVIRLDVRSVTAEMAGDPFGFGGESGGEDCSGERDYVQCFHGFCLLLEAVRQCRRRLPPVLCLFTGTAFTLCIAIGGGFLTSIF